MMFLKRLMTGMFSSNCYILGNAGEAAVIDPGVEFGEVRAILEEQGLILKYIILTHAHIDHILQMEELRSNCGGKTVIHEEDAPLLGDPMLNGAAIFGLRRTFGKADLTVKAGDSLDLVGLQLEILHTPGHTPGSMCIKVENCLFTGDTLFRQGVGRTDLGAGDHDKLMLSLKELIKLDDGLEVHPGHGSATTIGYERENNMYTLIEKINSTGQYREKMHK